MSIRAIGSKGGGEAEGSGDIIEVDSDLGTRGEQAESAQVPLLEYALLVLVDGQFQCTAACVPPDAGVLAPVTGALLRTPTVRARCRAGGICGCLQSSTWSRAH